MGIPKSNILAPAQDVYGQTRIDDPSANTPPNQGQDVFKDRGAIDRVDFDGPQAVLINPEDNDAAGVDRDPTLTQLAVGNAVLTDFTIRFTDGGTGVDDLTVSSAVVTVTRDGTLLTQGVDYNYVYNPTNNDIILQPLAGIWSTGTYVISLDNTVVADIAGNLLAPNQLNGETKFTITIGELLDFGNAPDTYGTLDASNGPSHVLSGLYLGAGVSPDDDGQPSPTASADTFDDGVTFDTIMYRGFTASVTVTASQAGKLDAWIDVDQNGVFDATDQIFASQPVTAGSNMLSFTVPTAAGGIAGMTFARFRLSSAGGLGPDGPAQDGEVEDYQVSVLGSPWQNINTSVTPNSRFDVNNDGFIDDQDRALIELQFTNNGGVGFRALTTLPPDPMTFPPGYIDVTGDGNFTLSDVNELNNYLFTNGPGPVTPPPAPELTMAQDTLAPVLPPPTVVAEDSVPIARFRLEITDASGTPIDRLTVGQSFKLKVYIQDIRPNPSSTHGLTSAYVDIVNDATNLVSQLGGANGVTFGSSYHFYNNDIAVGGVSAGLLDEVGNAKNSNITGPVGPGEFLLFSTDFSVNDGAAASATSDAADVREDSAANILDVLKNDDLGGTVHFTSNPADNGAHKVVLTDTAAVVDPANIVYGAASAKIDNQVRITGVGPTNHGGTVIISPDGQRLIYNPAPNFFGVETFTYTIRDADNNVSQATVNVTVEDSPDDIIGRTSGSWWAAQRSGATVQNNFFGGWSEPAGWTDVMTGDFTGDGIDDVVGRDNAGNWWLAKTTPSGFNTVLYGSFAAASGWQDIHSGDFNGDGLLDVIGRTSAGTWFIGANTGSGFVNQAFGGWAPIEWRDVQVGDFNGDGHPDVAGRTATGQWWVGENTGTTLSNRLYTSWYEGVGWNDVTTGDFNGDGRLDILGRTDSGQWWVAQNNGAGGFVNAYFGGWSPIEWRDVLTGDFNHDGLLDVVGRTSTGQWWVGQNTGSSFTNAFFGSWAEEAGWNDVMTGDFNNDGVTDIVGRTNGGQWWMGRSTGAAFVNQLYTAWSGVPWLDVSTGNFTRAMAQAESPPPGDPQMQFTVRTTDTNGNPITQIGQGHQFVVQVYVQDIRDPLSAPNQGVAGAYLDLLYPQASATLDGTAGMEVNFSTGAFTNNPDQGVMPRTAGILDEVGAVNSSSVPTGGNEQLFFQVTFTASGAVGNMITLTTDPADNPIHETAFFDPTTPLTPADITFGSATIDIVAVSPNPPVVVDDTYTINEDTTLVTVAGGMPPGVLDNDSDPDPGDTLTAILVSGVTHGTLNLNNDGSFTYQPDPNFNGVDSFTYVANDGGQNSNSTATVTINVTSVFDPPDAVDDSYATPVSTALVVPAATGVLSNDTQGDGPALTASLLAAPANGQVTLNADGSFVYVPNAGFIGTDTFTYTASGGALSDTATVSIEVGDIRAPAPSPATSTPMSTTTASRTRPKRSSAASRSRCKASTCSAARCSKPLPPAPTACITSPTCSGATTRSLKRSRPT